MKKLKMILLIMMLFIVSAGLYGCGSKSPSDTVRTYLEEVKKGENGDFSKLISNTLDETENQGESKKEEVSDESTKKLIGSMENLTYTINSEKIDGDSATVNVKVNGPDIATVMADFVQKAFTSAFSQAFSGNEATEEETNKLYESMLAEALDNVKYTERTGDILLTKKDGQWKISSDDALSKLLINMDGSFSNSDAESKKSNNGKIKTMVLNQSLKVETEHGNYNLTIEGARATDERNQFSEIQAKKVAILDYTYENISFGQDVNQDLYIDEYAFQVLDDEGNVLSSYPVHDENRSPKNVPVGGKCKASATFAVPTDSVNLNVTFTRGSQKVAKIKVPIK